MKGFDPEFRDLDHYIRVITDRIWEGRRVDDIHRYYGEGCERYCEESCELSDGRGGGDGAKCSCRMSDPAMLSRFVTQTRKLIT